MKNQGLPHLERGSAIVWVFVMIALFGILTVAMSKGSRTSLGSLDREQTQMAASEIIGYGQSVRDAVRSLKISGCTDVQINFGDSSMGATYNNPAAPTDDSCNVFTGAGGGISYYTPPSEWLDLGHSSKPFYANWFATASSSVAGMGTEGVVAGTCVGGGNGCKDLVFGLPYIYLNVCMEINRKLNFGGSNGEPPVDTAGAFSSSTSVPFAGVYPATGSEMGTATPNYSGHIAGCIEGSGDPSAQSYHFFQVLLTR